MGIDAVAAVALGAAAVGTELWWFLGPRPGPTAPYGDTPQDVHIVVRDGYAPATIPVEAGRPVRLHFRREETAPCSARVAFPTLGIDAELPPFATTVIEFMPKTPGDYPFRCHKGLLRGRVVALVGRDAARLNLGRGHGKHG